jgi:hypothetical protein
MTERGKEVFERLVQQCQEKGIEANVSAQYDVLTRIKMKMPLPLAIDKHWAEKQKQNKQLNSWQILYDIHREGVSEEEEYLFLRPQYSEKQQKAQPDIKDKVEYLRVIQSEGFGDKVYAVMGIVDMSSFRKKADVQLAENELRKNGIMGLKEHFSAVDLAADYYGFNTHDIVQGSEVTYSYSMLNPKQMDCMIERQDLSKLLHSLGYNQELTPPKGTAYEYKSPRQAYNEKHYQPTKPKSVERD